MKPTFDAAARHKIALYLTAYAVNTVDATTVHDLFQQGWHFKGFAHMNSRELIEAVRAQDSAEIPSSGSDPSDAEVAAWIRNRVLA